MNCFTVSRQKHIGSCNYVRSLGWKEEKRQCYPHQLQLKSETHIVRTATRCGKIHTANPTPDDNSKFAPLPLCLLPSLLSAFPILSGIGAVPANRVMGILKTNISNVGCSCCPPHQVTPPSTLPALTFPRSHATVLCFPQHFAQPLLPAHFLFLEHSSLTFFLKMLLSKARTCLSPCPLFFLQEVGLATGIHFHRQVQLAGILEKQHFTASF